MTILRVINANIAKEKGLSEAVTNAANDQLKLGIGVAGAIKRACGEKKLQQECDEFIRDMNVQLSLTKVPTGSIAITSAYNMHPTKAILHAVAPICVVRGVRTDDQAKQLKSAYDSVIEVAERNQYKSLAIPFLGAGVFNYPAEESVELALMCALNKCPSPTIKEIRFVSTDKGLLAHMTALLGGNNVSIGTVTDVQPLLAKIPRSTRDIGGSPSNQRDIIRCRDFALDITQWKARMSRLMPQPPPVQNTRSTRSQNPRNEVDAVIGDKTVTLQAVSKALKTETDAYIVFAECIDKNFLQLDLGPLANTEIRENLIAKLVEVPVDSSGWTTVSVPISITNNSKPKALICVARQIKDARLEGFAQQLFKAITEMTSNVPAQKLALILPTSCILDGKWRVVWPVFVLFSAWSKGVMDSVDYVTLLHATSDLNLARAVLSRETKFTQTTINRILCDLEQNFCLKLIPSPNHIIRFENDKTANSITQIFRDLTTEVEQSNVISVDTPIELVEANTKTIVSLGTLADVADQEGCILCIPIDSSLILSSTEITVHLRDRCGEDLEEELHEVSKLIDERGINSDDIGGLIIPVHSHSLRRFKAIFLMVNVDVVATSRTTDDEKWRLYSSYKKMMEYAKLINCKRLVVTISSAQSLGFRIETATAIACAAVFSACPSDISSVHLALNAKGSRKLLSDKIFNTNTSLTIADASEAAIFTSLVLPEPLKECSGFNSDCTNLMNAMMSGFISQSEGVCSQSSQRVEEDPDDFGGVITISVEEEKEDSEVEGDGRIVFVGRQLELQADLKGKAGDSYDERLNQWMSDHAREYKTKMRKFNVGASMVSSNFALRNYQKGLSHIVLRNVKSECVTEKTIREARNSIVSSIQKLEAAGATEVVLNIRTFRLSSSPIEIRRYRIVGQAGRCLEDLKLWLKTAKEVKCRTDVQNMVDRIVKKRSEGNLVVDESGELNVQIGERRRSRTKETPSKAKLRNYKARQENEVRCTRDDEEKRLFYQEDYARRKLRSKNNVTWEMSSKYKHVKITPTMRRDFGNALKLLLLMRSDPECASLLRRYKYINQKDVDTLSSRSKKKPHKKKLAKIWNSLQKRPELLHQMYSLSIIFKIIKNNKSTHETIKDTVAHYQFLLDTARELQVVGAKMAEKEGRKILMQLSRPVLELEGSNEDENLVRRVGRLRYHLARRDYEGEKVAMVDGIDEMLRRWRRVEDAAENSAEDVTVNAVDPEIAHEGIPQQLDVVVEDDTREADMPERNTHVLREDESAEEDHRHEDELEQESRRDDELTAINNRLSTVPRDVLEHAQEEVENIVSQEPDMQDHGPALPEIILPFTTYIHFCDEEKCEKLTADDCRFLIKKVNGYLELLKSEKFSHCQSYFEEAQEGETISALALLKKLAPCYCGLRSILNRYYKLRSSISAMLEGTKALKGNRLDELRVQLNENMPKEIRQIVNQALSVLYQADQEDFKEGKIRVKYAEMIKEFNAEMNRLMENKMCRICHTYTSVKDSFFTTSHPVAEYVRDPAIGDVFCQRCIDAIKLKKTNQLRIPANGYDTSEIPPELLELNWIERLLIQRIRPVINTFHLTDKGGRKTMMKGSRGKLLLQLPLLCGMLLLPVPTEATLTHVANTLPSAANLKIIVSSNTKNTIVSMERVIKALQVLKQTHEEYRDIAIDEDFEFPRDCIVGNGADNVELIAKDSSDPTLLQHDDIVPHVVQEVGGQGKMMKGIAYEHYKLKRNPYFPISIHSRNPDTRAFPWLFPDGKFGFHHPRPMSEKTHFKEHSERTVARFHLKYKDRRFATDPSFLSFVHGFLEGKTLLSSIGIRARMGKGNLTSDNFLRLMEEGTLDFQTSLSTAAAALRGRDAYWAETKSILKSHISTFGPPTWFVTLNPAEWDWPDVLEAYRQAYPKEDINSSNVQQWIAKDPFFFARRFQNRLNAVMRKVLLEEDGPLGTITHFFHRIEYQQRGTQHVHMLLWAKDAPKKDATDEEKLAYITKHVTARLPSKKTEPELHRIITTHQTHYKKHSKTCIRVVRYGRKVVKKCRFDYPRPAIPVAKFNKAAQELADIPGTFKKPYYVPRKKGEEQMINDYNPAISLIWGGNTDVQYVTDLPHIIPYLTSYTSKGESGKSGSAMQQGLRSAIDNKESHRVLHEMLRMRETGSLEMVDLSLGHALRSFDCDHVFVNTNKQGERHRMLHSSEELSTKQTAFKDNFYDVFYPGRPEEMEHLSMFQCLTHFTTDKGGPKEGNNATEDINPPFYHPFGNPFRFAYHTGNHHSQFFDFESDSTFPISRKLPIPNVHDKAFRRRRKPVVGRFFFPHLDSSNDECREDYYRRLCMAFIPWREETELLSAIPDHVFESFHEMWDHYTSQLKNGSADEQAALADLELLIRHHTFLLDAQAETYRCREEMRKRMAALEAEEDPEQGDLLLFEREVNEERMNRNIDAMNEGQKKIFDEVLKGIEMLEEYENAVKRIKEIETLTEDEKTKQIDELPKPDPVRLLISGTAGTGKSFLINNLADHLTVKYCEAGKSAEQPAVCIAAPTGIAAVQIRGSTIHSLFKIQVEKGSAAALRDMFPDALGESRALLKNVRLFIIDEMSMVSNVLLAKINLRLQEIFSSNEPFAGRNILLLGDLMQLPPVKASKIFENLHEYEVMKMFGGGVLPSANFFDMFAYQELTENMRQRADKKFGDIMLNARVQALTDVDIENLNSCIIDSENGGNLVSIEEAALFYVKKQTCEVDGDPTILALFATNAEVDTFNRLVMDARKMEIISIPASDSTSVKERVQNGNAPEKRNRFARPNQRVENRLDLTSEQAVRAKKFSRKKGRGKQTFTDGEEDSNLTGGLPKMLRVAINGRVMLRRNVSAAIGLVNGATGTLMGVERDINEEVEKLVIQFDGIEDIQKISKMTVQFDIGLDDQISRTQFPIVSAFAATVHKCQGLTLKNVLISTRSFFAPGMAFVAFSRVTSMKGLHLMDFNSNKVWCDLTSLRKYNELRESIGLPKYDVPPARTSRVRQPTASIASDVPRVETDVASSETPTTSRRKRKGVEQEGSESKRPRKRQPTVKEPNIERSKRTRDHLPLDDGNGPSTKSTPEKSKKPRHAPLEAVQSPAECTKLQFERLRNSSSSSILSALPRPNVPSCLQEHGHKLGYRFRNRGTDCFANAATNSFFCLQSLMEDLLRVPNKNPVVQLMIDAYTEKSDAGRVPMENNHPLRDLLYPGNVQDDADEMVLKIINNLDVVRVDGSVVQDSFRLQIDMKIPCGGCEEPIHWSTWNITQFMLQIGFVHDVPGTIEELLTRRAISESFGQSHEGTGCGVNALDESRPVEVTMPQYLVIVLEVDSLEMAT